MTNTVKLQFNETATLQNLRHAFNDQYSFVREIAQNARRAKATQLDISIQTDVRTQKTVVIFTDDGVGISDINDLFSISDSGWDADTKVTEKPYGWGFLSALYAAEHVRIESGEQLVEFDTDHALGQGDIEIQPSLGPSIEGCRITLTGVHAESLSYQINYNLFQGFAIPVFLNNEEVERPHRKTSGFHILDSRVGWARSAKKRDDDIWDKTTDVAWVAYYQGFQIASENNFGSRDAHVIVHLRESEFEAQLPDRSCLIDRYNSEYKITEEVKSFLREEFIKWWNRQPNKFTGLCLRLTDLLKCRYLYNNLDAVPGDWVFQSTNNPEGGDKYSRRLSLEHNSNAVPLHSLEDKKLVPALRYGRATTIRDLMRDQLINLLTKEADAVQLSTSNLPKDHPLTSKVMCVPSSYNFDEHTYTVVDASDTRMVTRLKSSLTGEEIQVCTCKTLNVRVDLDDYTETFNSVNIPWFQDDVLWIPENCNDFEAALDLIGPEGDFDKEVAKIRNRFYRLRGIGPDELLNQHLVDNPVPELDQGRFEVWIENGEVISVQSLSKVEQ